MQRLERFVLFGGNITTLYPIIILMIMTCIFTSYTAIVKIATILKEILGNLILTILLPNPTESDPNK